MDQEVIKKYNIDIIIVNKPTHIPPQAAATGILFSNSLTKEDSLCPLNVKN